MLISPQMLLLLDNRDNPNNPEMCKRNGNMYRWAKNYAKAADMYTKAISLRQFEPSYYDLRAICYFAMGKFAAAQVDSRRAIQLSPRNYYGYSTLYRSAFKLGDISACDLVLEMIRKLPEEVKGKIDLRTPEAQVDVNELKEVHDEIEKALAKKEYKEVIDKINEGLISSPADVSLLATKAKVLHILGEYSDAMKVVEEVMKRDANVLETLFIGGKCQYQLDNVEKAKVFLKKILELYPGYQDARTFNQKMNALNEIRLKAGKLAKTEQIDNPDQRKKDLEGAVMEYKKALNLIKTNNFLANPIVQSKLYYNIGITLCKISQDNKHEALKMFRLAQEHNETYDRAIAAESALSILIKKADERLKSQSSRTAEELQEV